MIPVDHVIQYNPHFHAAQVLRPLKNLGSVEVAGIKYPEIHPYSAIFIDSVKMNTQCASR